MKRQAPEARLQKCIAQHLRLNGAFFWSVPNERKSSFANMAHLKAMGLLPGVSDLIIVVDGKIHCLEVKAPEGKQSDHQRAFALRCFDEGIPYVCIFNIGEALDVLTKWRAIKPTRLAA